MKDACFFLLFCFVVSDCHFESLIHDIALELVKRLKHTVLEEEETTMCTVSSSDSKINKIKVGSRKVVSDF